MRKAIITTMQEAVKIPTGVDSKNAIIKRTDSNAWENVFEVFRDVNGAAYLICHGTEKGYINFHGVAIDNAYVIYRMLVRGNVISKREKLQIICCHGELVKQRSERNKEFQLEIFDDFKESDYNFEFINNTIHELHIYNLKLNNGNVRINLWTEENPFKTAIYRFQNCL